MTRYLLGVNFTPGVVETPMEEWKPEEITGHLDYYGNPVVTLNRAVAAAMAEGPAAGLALLEGVDERLAGHYRLDAVRAHLLEMAGDKGRSAVALSRRREAHDEPSGAPLPATQAARLKIEEESKQRPS